MQLNENYIMSGDVLGYIGENNGRSLAYFTKEDLFSTRKGTDRSGERVGTHKDGKFYNLNGEFIGAVSTSGAVSNEALDVLIKLCT